MSKDSVEKYETKIREPNKQKLEDKNENITLSTIHKYFPQSINMYSNMQLSGIFEQICKDYLTKGSQYLLQLKRINGGESLKKFFILTIESAEYLFIDFSLSEETSEHFFKLTNHFSDDKFCLPKILYKTDTLAITELVKGDTLENISHGTVRYSALQNTYFKCIDWIINFKLNNCEFIDKQESFLQNKIFNRDKLLALINISNCNKYQNKVVKLIEEVYNTTNVYMSHNDFQFGNVMLDKSNNLKVIDYHDCNYNIEHYDIVSMLYSPKKYFSDKDREILIGYYFDKLGEANLLNQNNYASFISLIIKTAFIRLCRSLEMRFRKILIPRNKTFEVYAEIRKGLNVLKKLERYVDIYISDSLSSLLPNSDLVSIVLSAGKGTRMNTDLPKCSVKILEKPMVEYISDVLGNVACEKNIYIVGYKKNIITDIINKCSNENDYFIDQIVQLGTGHAVIQAIPLLEDNKTVIVIMGDMPVLTYLQIAQLYKTHQTTGAVSTAVSSKLKMKNSSGKIIRNTDGEFQKIVEVKDIDLLYNANDAEKIKEISEVNTGMYVFNSTYLKQYLLRLDCNNAQKEYYLTDIIRLQKDDCLKVDCVELAHMCEPTGANTMEELKLIEEFFKK